MSTEKLKQKPSETILSLEICLLLSYVDNQYFAFAFIYGYSPKNLKEHQHCVPIMTVLLNTK